MKIFILITLVIILNSQFSYPQTNSLSLSDYKFHSIFGYKNESDPNILCMLGTNFFTAARTDNSDSIISKWFKDHPSAEIIPVASSGPAVDTDTSSRITFCIIADATDTLNNFLVHSGIFPGGSMLLPQSFKDIRNAGEGHPDPELFRIEILMDGSVYDRFIQRINEVELIAQVNSLGIWNDDFMGR